MKGKWLIVILLFCIPFCSTGQFSNAIHYTVKDGLPSSTVYTTVQDSLGFMWIGTEAGLVRFDGAQFHVFTTQDGLPDNEVLGLVYDNITTRLWIITYSKAACYYRNGQIYTAKNDSSLALIKCDFGEFINANAQEGRGVFLYNGAAVYECFNDKIEKIEVNIAPVFQVRRWSESSIDILCDSGAIGYNTGTQRRQYKELEKSISNIGRWIDDRLYRYMPGRVLVYKKLENGEYLKIREIEIASSRKPTRVIAAKDKIYISVAMGGVFEADNTSSTVSKQIWSGNVNDICTDKGNNLWITTNDDGLFIIKNSNTLNYNIDHLLIQNNVTSLHMQKDGTLFLGNSYGELFTLKNDILSPLNIRSKSNLEKVRGLLRYDNKLFCITNYSAISIDLHTKAVKEFPHISGGPKSLLLINKGKTILIGLLSGLLTIDTKTDSFSEDMSFHKRFIDIAQDPDGRVFCASLDGIYSYEDHTLRHIDSQEPALNTRVTSLCFTSDGILWIGTPANGILAYDRGKVVANINQSTYFGYHGTICRKIEKGKANEIWIATNNGVNKIRYHKAESLIIDNVTPINMGDGLSSNDVNDIQVLDSLVYIATSNGLTILNENKVVSGTPVPIYITSIKINDKDSSIHPTQYDLTYKQNNLKIDFIGVSLPSAGYLRYQYRLLGSGSDKWETTNNTSIEFRSLSAGTYIFEAVVLDKYGNRSKSVARVQFKITPAFYMTIWFWGLTFIVLMAIGFYIIRARFKRLQRQLEKEQSLNKKIIELEQQALKAQMNPHFIFNCLTAVQHFVNREDLYSANMYLSNFAKLIRKTLDLSGEQYISLDKEVSYLQNYIQLEKMRFQEKFQYEINVDPDIDEYSTQIPPMLMQPIIENAIRHGLRNKDTDTGLLKIDFTQEDHKIICMIDDNGIGMKRAKELKTATHVEYQSKGMSLTMSRIQAINMISDKKITIEIKDKYDNNNQALGTLVILSFEQERNT